MQRPHLKLAPAPRPVQPADDSLQARAERIWPGRPGYQRQWIASVRFLRAGRGWVLEGAKTDWHSTVL